MCNMGTANNTLWLHTDRTAHGQMRYLVGLCLYFVCLHQVTF